MCFSSVEWTKFKYEKNKLKIYNFKWAVMFLLMNSSALFQYIETKQEWQSWNWTTNGPKYVKVKTKYANGPQKKLKSKEDKNLLKLKLHFILFHFMSEANGKNKQLNVVVCAVYVYLLNMIFELNIMETVLSDWRKTTEKIQFKLEICVM